MKKVFLILSVFSTLAVSAQTVQKKVALTKGQQLEQQSQINMTLTQETAGQVMEIKMESSVTNLIEVKDNTPSGFSVANTLKKVLMNMNMMGQEMKFDSDKQEDLDGQLGQAYKDKINKPQEYTVNKEGVITEAKNKAAANANDPSAMFGSLMSSSSEEKEGSNFNALANLPAKGAKVGDTWTDSSSEEGSKAVHKYTLKEVNGNNGVVSVESDVSVSKQMQEQNLQIDMKGKTTGEYTFDVTTGIIKSRKITTKANGSMETQGMNIPMTIETTIVSLVNNKK